MDFLWILVVGLSIFGAPFALGLWLTYVNKSIDEQIEREMLWMK